MPNRNEVAQCNPFYYMAHSATSSLITTLCFTSVLLMFYSHLVVKHADGNKLAQSVDFYYMANVTATSSLTESPPEYVKISSGEMGVQWPCTSAPISTLRISHTHFYTHSFLYPHTHFYTTYFTHAFLHYFFLIFTHSFLRFSHSCLHYVFHKSPAIALCAHSFLHDIFLTCTRPFRTPSLNTPPCITHYAHSFLHYTYSHYFIFTTLLLYYTQLLGGKVCRRKQGGAVGGFLLHGQCWRSTYGHAGVWCSLFVC